MLSTALVVFALQVVTPLGGHGSVHGTVRSQSTDGAIAGTEVTVDGAQGVAARSDSSGAYALTDIEASAHRLRFVASGYDTLVIDVLLTAGASLRLDVALARTPATLATVRVIGSRSDGRDATAPGASRLSRTDLDETPVSDDPDLFRMLASAPQAQVGIESQAAVHVRGGSSDQNMFLLDGAPVYSPLHGAQAMSAFSPDIVDAMILHGGAPSARYGGRLSSVIDVRTSPAPAGATSVRGALGNGALRSMAAVPLAAGRASLTLSGRHSIGGLLHDGAAEVALPGSWSDLYGKLALRFGANAVDISSFIADNGLGFPSNVTTDHGETDPRPRGHNQFEWTSATQAITWRRSLVRGLSIETRGWRARFDGLALWESRRGAIVLGNRVQNTGASAVVERRRPSGVLTAGLETERMATSYDAIAPQQPGSADSGVVRASIHLASTPTISSAFVENEWRLTDGLTIGAGLRGTVATRATPRIEPRASITYHPVAKLSMSLGYARMHQYSQSLRNEESLLGSILSPDLLVAVGVPRVPIARSDELAASTTILLDDHTSLDLDWYARALHGLVLVAPVTGEPFATSDFVVGSGRAWGAGASLERHLDRLSLQGAWSFGRVTRRTAGSTYRPAFAPGQSASIAAAYRLGARTRIRSAIWASSGRLTTPLADEVGWDTRDAFSGARELSGTPEHAAGPIGGATLPNYLRIDFGVRHAVPLRRLGVTLTGFADVNNALARENVATYVMPGASPSRHPLVMLPASVVVGLEWKY